MEILLTNDDGIFSEGIYAFWKSLKAVGSVSVVAPEAERSAVGHAITMSDPLRVKKVNRRNQSFGYAVSGTPADCVKIAINSLLKKKPDIVVSGINLGPNTGFSVLYSGTVSGATEGAIFGIPSMAVSLGSFKDPDFSYAAQFAAKVARRILKVGLPKGTFLSVNVPALPKSKIKGVRVTTQGKTPFRERFDKRVDPREHTYYWLSGEVIDTSTARDSDITAMRDGYISITPLQYDLTDYDFIGDLMNWRL